MANKVCGSQNRKSSLILVLIKPYPLFLKWVNFLASVHVVKAHMGGSQLSKSKIEMGMCLSLANGPTAFSLAHGWDKIICKYESPHFVIKQLLAGFTTAGGGIMVIKSFLGVYFYPFSSFNCDIYKSLSVF